MKLADVDRRCFETLPSRDGAVEVLWVNGYYDGPLSGIASVDGRRVLFEVADRTTAVHGDGERRFWLVELSPGQLREEETWHDLFCEHVGTHWDFTDRPRVARPESEFHKYYDPASRREPPDYQSNTVIGWCSELEYPQGS